MAACRLEAVGPWAQNRPRRPEVTKMPMLGVVCCDALVSRVYLRQVPRRIC